MLESAGCTSTMEEIWTLRDIFVKLNGPGQGLAQAVIMKMIEEREPEEDEGEEEASPFSGPAPVATPTTTTVTTTTVTPPSSSSDSHATALIEVKLNAVLEKKCKGDLQLEMAMLETFLQKPADSDKNGLVRSVAAAMLAARRTLATEQPQATADAEPAAATFMSSKGLRDLEMQLTASLMKKCSTVQEEITELEAIKLTVMDPKHCQIQHMLEQLIDQRQMVASIQLQAACSASSVPGSPAPPSEDCGGAIQCDNCEDHFGSADQDGEYDCYDDEYGDPQPESWFCWSCWNEINDVGGEDEAEPVVATAAPSAPSGHPAYAPPAFSAVAPAPPTPAAAAASTYRATGVPDASLQIPGDMPRPALEGRVAGDSEDAAEADIAEAGCDDTAIRVGGAGSSDFNGEWTETDEKVRFTSNLIWRKASGGREKLSWVPKFTGGGEWKFFDANGKARYLCHGPPATVPRSGWVPVSAGFDSSPGELPAPSVMGTVSDIPAIPAAADNPTAAAEIESDGGVVADVDDALEGVRRMPSGWPAASLLTSHTTPREPPPPPPPALSGVPALPTWFRVTGAGTDALNGEWTLASAWVKASGGAEKLHWHKPEFSPPGSVGQWCLGGADGQPRYVCGGSAETVPFVGWQVHPGSSAALPLPTVKENGGVLDIAGAGCDECNGTWSLCQPSWKRAAGPPDNARVCIHWYESSFVGGDQWRLDSADGETRYFCHGPSDIVPAAGWEVYRGGFGTTPGKEPAPTVTVVAPDFPGLATPPKTVAAGNVSALSPLQRSPRVHSKDEREMMARWVELQMSPTAALHSPRSFGTTTSPAGLQDTGTFWAEAFDLPYGHPRRVAAAERKAMADQLAALAALEAEHGHHQVALNYLAKCLAIRAKTLGDSHSDTARARRNIAVISAQLP